MLSSKVDLPVPLGPYRTLMPSLSGPTSIAFAKQPAPFVLQSALNDFYVSYELNAYTDRPREMLNIFSNLHRNIQDKFNEEGV